MHFYVETVVAKDVLKPGQNVILDVFYPEELEGEYRSNVHDVDFERNILTLSMPSFKGRLVPLPKGTRCTVKVIEKSALYTFRTVVLESGRGADGFPITKVPFPENLQRIQRRRYKRLELVLEGTFRLSTEDTNPKRFVTKDISAGGMLMVTSEVLMVGQVVFVDLPLEEGLKLEAHPTKVVREAGATPEGLKMYGMEFLSVSPSLEKKLVMYIFKKELEMKKKGGV